MERKNSSPSLVAPKTVTALRRTGRVAHKVAKAGAVARKKLAAISMHVKALRRQLQENTEGFKYDLP
jgi:hypothetical protein